MEIPTKFTRCHFQNPLRSDKLSLVVALSNVWLRLIVAAFHGGQQRYFKEDMNNIAIITSILTISLCQVAIKVYSISSEADMCSVKCHPNLQLAYSRPYIMKLQMLLREARAWSKLTHENILPLFGIWENFNVCGMHNGTLGLVSPWLEKGTLQSFLHKNPGTPDVERMRLVRITIVRISLFSCVSQVT